MLRTKLFAAAVSALCLCSLPAMAAETEGVPCFSQEPEDTLTGICLTQVPDQGTLLLGSRVLRAGDVLTVSQAVQMTFAGDSAEMEYLPIFAEGTGESVILPVGSRQEVPVAEDSAVETYKNLPINGKLKVSGGENLTYTITRQPKRGVVVLGENGSFTYTPKKNKVGIDSFTYTAADAAGKTSREATVTVTILKPGDATQYTDTQGLDCRFTAEWLKNTGIFAGETVDENLCFNPEKYVTRGEFVTMLVKVLDLPVDESLTATGYTDQIPTWLQPYLAAALRSGLTSGLADQETFGPDQPICVADAMAMLQNARGGAVETLAQTDGEAPLTRALASQVLYQASKAE